MYNFLLYLLQVAVCQTAFYLLFRFALSKQPTIQANRGFLLFSTFISFIIPVLSIEVWSTEVSNFSLPVMLESSGSTTSQKPISAVVDINWFKITLVIILMTYLVGVVFHLIKLVIGIDRVTSMIRLNKLTDKNDYQIIRINKGPAFFSFWKYIFINDQKLGLAEEDLRHVIRHEQVHIDQRHTLDLLLMELATAICWFNPFAHKMKQALCQVHEFIADREVVLEHVGIDHYSKLILQLSTGNEGIPLTHQFSKINIKNRINMLNQSTHNKMKAFNYLFAVPVLAILMAFFSCTTESTVSAQKGVLSIKGEQELIIGEVRWNGNEKYSDEYLNDIMGLKPGSIYEKEKVQNLLKYDPDKTTVSDLYMDSGHLFYHVNVKDTVINKKVLLIFEVYEGATATIDKIIIKGNDKIETQKILEMLDIKKGDLFNRTKLIASQKNIAESGFFVSDSVGIDPIPHDGNLVDFELVVIEL